MDTDAASGAPIRVILSNLALAQLVYTADLSMFPDMWDALFLTAATALLGAYFSNALSRDKDQLAQQTGIVRGAVEAARMQNANEGSPTADLRVDWLSIRQSSGGWGYPSNSAQQGMWFGAGYDELAVPGGLRF
jgi:hypothetical protein